MAFRGGKSSGCIHPIFFKNSPAPRTTTLFDLPSKCKQIEGTDNKDEERTADNSPIFVQKYSKYIL